MVRGFKESCIEGLLAIKTGRLLHGKLVGLKCVDPDTATYENDLQRSIWAIEEGESKGDALNDLYRALEVMDQVKFLEIKLYNKVKAKAQEAPRVFVCLKASHTNLLEVL